MRVLVVEDHVTLAHRIAQGLRQAGMATDVVQTARMRWMPPADRP
jgi:DNA-binding response OmpR family regulator